MLWHDVWPSVAVPAAAAAALSSEDFLTSDCLNKKSIMGTHGSDVATLW